MNREEAQKIQPIVAAFAEGKVIQVCTNTGIWADSDGISLYSLCTWPEGYRIKPEPTYRPFKDGVECWEEMQKHKPFGWIKLKNDPVNTHIGVAEVRSGGLYLSGPRSGVLFNFKEAFDALTFADNTPFGMKE